MTLDDWMSEEEAAREVRKTIRTLRDWRKRRTGPPYAYFGRTIRYYRPALIEFFKSNQIMPEHADPENESEPGKERM